MVSVNLYSENSKELERFLSSFYNSSFNINNNLNWEHKYENPVEITEIIGVLVDNFEDFKIMMWVSLDKGVYIHVTKENADGTTSTLEKTVDGVYILYGNELKFKEIVKLYETKDYVICDTNQDNEDLFSGSTIKLYDKIVTEGTDLYAGKIVKQSTEVE